MYIFDTSPFSTLFKNYYRRRFPTLWAQFDMLITEGRIVSTREVLREINDGAIESLRDWCKGKQALFPAPTHQEGAMVAQIFAVPHFQHNIEQQKLLKGGRNADPFVIARAMVDQRTVVTLELLKPNAAKIPNICRHFSVPCVGLEEFMEKEGWEF